MQQANLPIEQVLKRVRIDVATETKQRQIPWESSSLMGDFYFKVERDSKSPIKMAADMPESLEQASIQPNVLAPSINQPRNRLSIFPMLPPEIYGSISSLGERAIPFLKDSTINALSETLQNDKRFDSIKSYYDLKTDLKYSKIENQTLDKYVEDKIWIKKSFFSSRKEPNIELVIEIANKIESDYVFMSCYYVPTGSAQGLNADFYLIKVRERKVYYKDYECSLYSSYTEIPKFIKLFFNSFSID
jgi:hypothetical protein